LERFMLKPIRRSLLSLILVAAIAALSPLPSRANEFTFDLKANADMARRLNIPVYFAVPASARLALPETIDTSDRLIEFKHPNAMDAQGEVGLRVVVAKRAGLAQRLGKSGLVQTGDLLLTVRPEWGGAGPYPSIQMGISHVSIAYVKGGIVYNIDNPMSAEYLGSRGQLDSAHFKSITAFHIVRPRGLTDAQHAQITSWASRLAADAKFLYPRQISFNSDYNEPQYKPGQPVIFVKTLGQIALGQNPGKVAMFCSEFAWSLLALRDCDPKTTAQTFKSSSVPSCVRPIMQPMHAAGDLLTRRFRPGYAGLADGPLLVVNAMKLPEAERTKLLRTVFAEKPGGTAKMSEGHRQVAQTMKPKFAPLEKYYLGMLAGKRPTKEARMLAQAFNKGEVPDNYTPTSFLINTLLPTNNPNRTMDYVATVVLE
jgi:hypothetical protein